MSQNEKKIVITFVIQGKEFPIEVNINQNIKGAVHKALKQAAYSILKPNEKRFRLREKIINTIIERISEEKAIAHLGR